MSGHDHLTNSSDDTVDWIWIWPTRQRSCLYSRALIYKTLTAQSKKNTHKQLFIKPYFDEEMSSSLGKVGALHSPAADFVFAATRYRAFCQAVLEGFTAVHETVTPLNLSICVSGHESGVVHESVCACSSI